ncbi:unnamed protein product [Schistosoma curassoni]|uniref:Skp1_POZ domain-containing protein n=1 Tax=Schistosoma curassoni TaxID=6186 RepID=A0A183L436_9TREM|nr:unnamed protein product [Schistosoma curassoni]
MAETWTNIQTDLDNKQIRPITPDIELLSCISEWCKKQINNVQCKQQEILDATKTYESTEEQKYYSSVSKFFLHFFVLSLMKNKFLNCQFRECGDC